MSWKKWQELLDEPVHVRPVQVELFEDNPGGALGVSLNTEAIRQAVEGAIERGDLKC